MRNVLFLIYALALFAAGFTSVAHADMPNMECSHHVSNAASLDYDCTDDQTQDHADMGECQDCCCIHSHVFAGTFTAASTSPTLKGRIIIEPHTSLRSSDLPPLYRPPIA